MHAYIYIVIDDPRKPECDKKYVVILQRSQRQMEEFIPCILQL